MRIIHLSVDIREAHRSLLHARATLPVQPGAREATFTTPLWIQELHSPAGPVGSIAGLQFYSAEGGEVLRWRRNPLRTEEYVVDVPEGVETVMAMFDAVITWKVTRRMVRLGWEHVLMYPAGRHLEGVKVRAEVTVPKGWGVATALEDLGHVEETSDEEGRTLRYQATSVLRLADSPVLTGEHFRKYVLTKDGGYILCVAADTKEAAVMPMRTLHKFKRMLEQTLAIFRHRHFDTFRLMLALSDQGEGYFYGGYEHHDSFEAGLPANALSDPAVLDDKGYLIAHEFIHSWCGKYRRPAGHVPHDFVTPLNGRLMWVYEGLSAYYEGIVAVRSGLMSRTTYLAKLAQKTAWLEGQSGRMWRSIEDTGTGASLSWMAGPTWANWTRGTTDYYFEGVLLWLDVDTLIRSQSEGKRSLDDFTGDFFGQGQDTGPKVVPYTFEDIVAALDKVMPYDWHSFFKRKVLDVTPDLNLDGVKRAGYEFSYSGTPNARQDTDVGLKEAIWNSVGIKTTDSGQVIDVRRGGPGDAAKLAPRQTVAKVGGSSYSLDALATEIKAQEKGCIRLTMAQEGDEWDVEIDYCAGLRYPRLELHEGAHDMLHDILGSKDATRWVG